MDWNTFALGFWHPFGPYCKLKPQEILDWKREEALRNGWTLWSFAYVRSMQGWLDELNRHTGSVHVLCSHSPLAVDPWPAEEPSYASHYQCVSDAEWKEMPKRETMYVTNPFKRGGRATAFIVRRVEIVDPTIPMAPVSWYSRSKGKWQDGSLHAGRVSDPARRWHPASFSSRRAGTATPVFGDSEE